MAEVLEVLVPEMLVDAIDVLVLLAKCWTLKCCCLRCWLQKSLEELVLVRDVLEVLVFVLVADMLEVEHAFALVVVCSGFKCLRWKCLLMCELM